MQSIITLVLGYKDLDYLGIHFCITVYLLKANTEAWQNCIQKVSPCYDFSAYSRNRAIEPNT